MLHRLFNSKPIAAAASLLLSTGPAWAFPPAWLPWGTWDWTTGTTWAQMPELGGVVLHDRLTSFQIRSDKGDLLFEGKLQDRVVRSSTNNKLHFYYRVRDTNATLAGRLNIMDVNGFTDAGGVLVDFRPDGLGTVATSRAIRNIVGTVRFAFSGTLDPGESSKFCFIMPLDCESYGPFGLVTLMLSTGETASIAVMRPR